LEQHKIPATQSANEIGLSRETLGKIFPSIFFSSHFLFQSIEPRINFIYFYFKLPVLISFLQMEYDKKKLEWLEFDLLKGYPHLVHGVFQRHGGVSNPPFGTLNGSDRVGDHPDSVKVNRERIRRILNINQLVFPHQQHGITVARVSKETADHTHHADALFTTEFEIGLAVTHADCQGAILFDPVKRAIAVAHVGWRGNVQNLYTVVVDALKQNIGTKPEDLLVCISPSLGPDHAEFKNYKTELPTELWSFQKQPYYFDLWELSTAQLIASGVREKNIELARICTACSGQDYFSYRNAAKTGRNVTVVALR
jgi:hypothetical protein